MSSPHGDGGYKLEVQHDEGDRFLVSVGEHQVAVDQPEADGGTNTAPTPTALFIASLASCVAFYGRRFLKRHQLPEDITVRAGWVMGSTPARVTSISIDVSALGLPPAMRGRFLQVVEHCTVHNTLQMTPTVEIGLSDGDADEIAS